MSQHEQDRQQERELLEHYRRHSQGEPSAAVDALILAAAREAVEPPRPSFAQRLHAWLFGAGYRTRWSMAVAGLAVFGIGLDLALYNKDRLPAAYDAPAPVAAEAPAPMLREALPGVAHEASDQPAELAQKKKAEALERKAEAFAVDANASYPVSPPAAAPRQMAPAKPAAAPPAGALADFAAEPVAVDAARAQAPAQAAAKAEARAKVHAEVQADGALHEELSEEQLAATLGHSEVDEAPPLELQLHNVLRMRREGMHADADRLLSMLKREHPQRDLDAELKRLQAEAEGSR